MKAKIILFFSLLFVIMVTFHLPVSADRSFTIPKYENYVQIQQNGTARITENVRYDFDGAFNGATMDIDTSGLPQITDLQVAVDGQPFVSSNSEQNGTFKANYVGDTLKIRVYSPTDTAKKDFTYTYTLKNAIINYNDTAEFNRKLVGKNWQETLDHVAITIMLPKATQNGELQAWAHGPLDGTVLLQDNKTVKLTADNVKAGQFVEAHVIFPKNIVPFNQNIQAVDKKAAIQAQEAKLADQANFKRTLAKTVFYGGSLLILFLVLITISITYIKYTKSKVALFKDKYFHDIPLDMSPAVMNKLIFAQTGANDIVATIMDLVRKRQLTIEELPHPSGNKKKATYTITKLPVPSPIELLSHETRLITWLIDKIGDGEKVTLKEINAYAKKNTTTFRTAFTNWKNSVGTEAKKYDYFDKEASSKATKLLVAALTASILIGIGIIIFSIFASIFSLFACIVSILAFVILIVFWITQFPVKNQEGTEEFAKWHAFKRYIKDVGNMDIADVGSIAIWDHYLSYSISLGLTKEVLKAASIHFSPEQVQQHSGLLYYYYGGAMLGSANHANMDTAFAESFQSSFESSFSGALASSASSGSGGGGGFSGGSSGGGGGGSGGGAF
ncbi:hypothetical protein BMT55_15570 [Listeria newyorkensis]|uniref:DUF2207 domain-containing protein n=1 Tax=Listeria newyorkensis TaxID=1497681 RepID=A0ABX4XJB0_9LIST|nr:DUF2207 domain-containing protein [Listeria newyorkensis]KGL45751.1 hypothetical protein EP58_03420 [Listeria newyorkensis]KMT62776.1 hypothetical protein X559_0867 [Listeria newyorkensis]PNP88273.1 hypothetical protein BMT55_15570 [Listeria newyorkensis]WAO20729.1 DUF2207 domain-containing protein [Listeria newyorkensis]SQC55599.1 Uncharacterized conserved protein [Listeria newyorkensis]